MPRVTVPKPAGPASVSEPPCGVTVSGTVTVPKPGTFVVRIRLSVSATPALDVAGMVVTPTVIDADAPGATVPELAPWMAKTGPAMAADQTMPTGPVFWKVYVFEDGLG